MKKIISIIFVTVICLSLCACGSKNKELKPESAQMKSICELATTKCYFHNVAKMDQKNAETFLLFIKKDKKFWMEYSGEVTLGVDATKIQMDIKEKDVYIKMPKAKVLSCKVDEKSLNEDSYIVAKGSAKVKAEDTSDAYKEAQKNMKKEAQKNTALLEQTRIKTQKIIESYINNISELTGKKYEIHWENLK